MRSLGKQPAETFLLAVDFSTTPLATGETLVLAGSSVTATINGTDTAADIVTEGSVAVSGTKLQARLTGGDEGVIYKVSFRAATSMSNLFEQDVLVGVAD